MHLRRVARAQLFTQIRTLSASSSATNNYDLVIVGGGIVGCATARQITINHPQLKIALLEKEDRLAAHQSGHNSGVIHAGIYYVPGSLKAKLCVRGMDLTYDYCNQNDVPYKKVGKLIVAVDEVEVERLEALFKRAQLNGCRDIELIDGNKIPEIEPHCRGLKAIWSPHTGVIDFGLVTKSYGDFFLNQGGTIKTGWKVKEFKFGNATDYPLTLVPEGSQSPISCKYAITCAGLHSDRVAALSGCSPVPKIVPFRGEYLLLKENKRYLAKGNIYPVPDPRFPFLGVHFTPRMNGDVWLGPNAVLAYKREGYRYTDVNIRDLADALAFRGMQKLIYKYMGYGMNELYRGLWIRAQVKLLQRFVPELTINDVTRGPAGVRAQALDMDGNLVDDFVFDSGTGHLSSCLLHVRNAPSPAATSSLAIAEMVAEKAKETFNL